jgi:hypothetical protein
LRICPAGEWQCQIPPLDGHHPYQEGIIHLLTKQEGFCRDMRLPRHVIPTMYNITLTPFILPGNYTIAGILNMAAKMKTADNKCNYKAEMMKLHFRFTMSHLVYIRNEGH